MVENNKITINSGPSITELKNFVATGTSSSKTGANDDLVSATLLVLRMMAVMRDWDPAYTTHLHKQKERSNTNLHAHIC